MLLSTKTRTDTLNERTKTKPQETHEFKMDKQMQTFSFSPPVTLVEECKLFLGVTSFEYTISVLNITDENNSLSFTIPGLWQTKSDDKTSELNELFELMSLELHVKEVRKRGSQIKIRDYDYKLSDFDTQKNEILEEIKNVKYNDLKI